MAESKGTGGGAEVVTRLAHMERGDRGTVVRLDGSDPDRMHKLLALGVLPGSSIELQEKRAAFVFQLGWSRFAVDRDLAGAILVRVDRDG